MSERLTDRPIHSLVDRVVELEAELKASRPHAMFGKAMIDAFEAIRDAGLADDPPKDECLNAYIETWAKQKARVAELEAENERLRGEIAKYQEWEAARYDGARHARMGGSIDDCPYGSMKATSELRDSTKEGLWKQGFDTATYAKLKETNP